MSFLFPLGMAAAGALLPLIVLYLLKQKRMEVKVATNFLWERALEDLRASSLFQRLRTQLLLLLQALAILLFALAAAGASLQLDLGDQPRHLIMLLDRSRSMKTVDHDGASRFEAALEHARDAVSGLRGGDEMMIVAFDATAEVVQPFTGDSDRLEDVLDKLAPRDLPTNAADGLLLALSYGQAAPGFTTEVILVSDGAIADELPDLPYTVTYARVGKESANQGIGFVRLGRTIGEPLQLIVRVDNAAPEEVTRRVVLRRAGKVTDARDVVLAPEGERTVFFELEEPTGEEAEIVALELSGKDLLPDDDRVELVLRPSVPRTGLLVAQEPSIYLDPDKVGSLHPGLTLVAATLEESEAAFAGGGGAYDLVIYDGIAPTKVPPVPAQIYVNCLPPGSGLGDGGTQEFPIVIDWDRSHPTTVRCHFDDVHIGEAIKLTGTERSHVLVESTGGPLMLLTPVPGREVVVVAFPPGESNMPLKLAWPLFLSNTFDFLLSNVERTGERALNANGDALVLDAVGPATVKTPGGAEYDLAPDARGKTTFAATVESGIYRVSYGEVKDALHAYALLSPAESRIGPVEEITLGGNPVQSNPSAIARNVLLRDPLLLLALAILMLEWAIWCGRR